MTLLPARLRLPPLRTARVAMTLAELDFGFEGELKLRQNGDAWQQLCRCRAVSIPCFTPTEHTYKSSAPGNTVVLNVEAGINQPPPCTCYF